MSGSFRYFHSPKIHFGVAIWLFLFLFYFLQSLYLDLIDSLSISPVMRCEIVWCSIISVCVCVGILRIQVPWEVIRATVVPEVLLHQIGVRTIREVHVTAIIIITSTTTITIIKATTTTIMITISQGHHRRPPMIAKRVGRHLQAARRRHLFGHQNSWLL